MLTTELTGQGKALYIVMAVVFLEYQYLFLWKLVDHYFLTVFTEKK